MSHTNDPTQYTDGSAPLTNWRCFALDARSDTRKRTKDAGTNESAIMTLTATTRSVAEFKYLTITVKVIHITWSGIVITRPG